MKNIFLNTLAVLAVISIAACSKKSPDTPLTMVPERLEITPATASMKVGETTTFSLKYFNTLGEEAPVPSGIQWSSSQTNIATISSSGVATGIASGQTEIKAKRNNTEATSLLTVVSNDNEIATITIETGNKELLINDTGTLIAVARNINNQVITGKSFSWQGTNSVAVQLATNGQVKGLAWGTSSVQATSDGKVSAPVMVQVIRKGSFSGSGSKGTAKLKFENGVLKLETSADFGVSSGAPDLRMYLGNNSGNVNGAVELATLNNRTGALSFNIPSGVSIGQFRYAVVWCKQFGGAYGVADFGN